eukprot:CAMPEP_0198603038 /NCGR_PEP_ID=MMETSP1462-20131121/151459_1 /TAXON_ID=1333877 /ORGANISM="Brandtodinium nutriculum, Strain RCC3387" /LENGTH=41 /DNA_ID= /DNA_START= /DNA_END= /DNA_ORIENTATION=
MYTGSMASPTMNAKQKQHAARYTALAIKPDTANHGLLHTCS